MIHCKFQHHLGLIVWGIFTKYEYGGFLGHVTIKLIFSSLPDYLMVWSLQHSQAWIQQHYQVVNQHFPVASSPPLNLCRTIRRKNIKSPQHSFIGILMSPNFYDKHAHRKSVDKHCREQSDKAQHCLSNHLHFLEFGGNQSIVSQNGAYINIFGHLRQVFFYSFFKSHIKWWDIKGFFCLNHYLFSFDFLTTGAPYILEGSYFLAAAAADSGR